MFKITYQDSAPAIANYGTYDKSLTAEKQRLRTRREQECFPIVNRGRLWYNKLSTEQYAELTNWYEDWLNVTDTLQVPAMPVWLNEKLTEQEDIL